MESLGQRTRRLGLAWAEIGEYVIITDPETLRSWKFSDPISVSIFLNGYEAGKGQA